MKFQGSAQLQTVLAMYDQEMNRSRVLPSYQRLKTVIRRHIDQMIRTRNFKARNARIETWVLVKSHKGRKASVERKVGECLQWKATGQCSRGDSYSFNHGPIVLKKHKLPFLFRERRHRLTEEGQKKNHSRYGLKGKRASARNRRVIYGTLPYA